LHKARLKVLKKKTAALPLLQTLKLAASKLRAVQPVTTPLPVCQWSYNSRARMQTRSVDYWNHAVRMFRTS